MEAVRRTIARYGLMNPGERTLVACSGGPDSAALLHILVALGYPVAVAHFNHHLRGDESDRDAAFVAHLAGSLKLVFLGGEADVAGEARRERLNIEECARRLRMSFLRDAASRLHCHRIALGHTLDDLVETFFMKLFRGSGCGGLRAVAPRRGPFVRPLIDLRKSQLLAYLDRLGLSFVVDSTNADARRFRNRIRMDLLPCVETASPRAFTHIRNAVDVLRREEAFLAAAADGAFGRCVEFRSDRAVALGLRPLGELPAALLARVFRLALSSVGSTSDYRGIRHLLQWFPRVGVEAACRRPFPGDARVRRQGERIWVMRATTDRPTGLRVPLPVPGTVTFLGLQLSARLTSRGEGPAQDAMDDLQGCRLDYSRTGPDLHLRTVDRADAYVPCGRSGSRSVRKLLLNRKIPALVAARLPAVIGSPGICWVPGLPVAETCKVTSETSQILHVSMTSGSDP